MKHNYNYHKGKKRYKKSKSSFISKILSLCFLPFCCIIIFFITLFIKNFLFLDNHSTDLNFPVDNITDVSAKSNDIINENIDYDETLWYLTLVNKWHHVPDNYEVELTELTNGELVDTRIYDALQEMFDDARSNDVYPTVVSGYRTNETQQYLLDEKISDFIYEGYSKETAEIKAESWVAKPGASEHQLGIAVDINSDGLNSTNTEVYEWLEQNSYKYGFIRRYTYDKSDITGVVDEPWHYRYVGIEAAADIYYQDICLEEYLNTIFNHN